jgi:hypothetical protein
MGITQFSYPLTSRSIIWLASMPVDSIHNRASLCHVSRDCGQPIDRRVHTGRANHHCDRYLRPAACGHHPAVAVDRPPQDRDLAKILPQGFQGFQGFPEFSSTPSPFSQMGVRQRIRKIGRPFVKWLCSHNFRKSEFVRGLFCVCR